MTIRHDCANADRMSNGIAAWECVLDRFRSMKAPTVVSIVSQLARLKMSGGEGIQNFFIRAQELYSRFQHAGEHLSSTIFNALYLTGFPEHYDHFIMQESFNPSGDYTDLRMKLLNYSLGKWQTLEQSANHIAKPSKSFSGVTRNNESRKDDKRVDNCFVSGILGHIERDWRKKEGASCNICKRKGLLDKVCQKRQ